LDEVLSDQDFDFLDEGSEADAELDVPDVVLEVVATRFVP
jgi:hypothetical protein